MKYALFLILLFIYSCTHSARNPSSQYGSILYIGDSQSAGHLGKLVYEHLKQSFDEKAVRVFGIGSSSPRHWGDPRTSKNGKWICERKGRFNNQFNVELKQKICGGSEEHSALTYLNQSRPELVIFQFLGNSMGFNESYIKKKVTQLLDEIEGQECVFITSPPYFHELEEKNKLRLETESFFLKAVGNRCEVVQGMNEQNRKIFPYDRGNYASDQIHLSKKGARLFFEQIKMKLP